MSFGYDNEFHANRMELINEQREYARIEHEQKTSATRDERRERFARAAMQGLLAFHGSEGVKPTDLAHDARLFADALIAELDKEVKA